MKVLSGNEAIAQSMFRNNVRYATAYPGTPSTEAAEELYKFSKKSDLIFEWSTNEAVALEKALAQAWCGNKSFVSMKHVGFNVAMDTIQVMGEMEYEAGVLIYVAGDPVPSSSQNTQDNRPIIASINIPGLEPSNSQECYDFTEIGLKLSEKYKIPFILSTNMKIAHGESPVNLGEIRREYNQKIFKRDPSRYISSIQTRKNVVKKRISLLPEIEKDLENLVCEVNGEPQGNLGIICSNLIYGQTKEVINKLNKDLPILRLGTFHPLPENIIKNFINGLENVLVVEELLPYLEEKINLIARDNNINTKIYGKRKIELLPNKIGEITKDDVLNAVNYILGIKSEPEEKRDFNELLIGRTPTFCAGCPHRMTHYILNSAVKKVYKTKDAAVKVGDIGCYGSLAAFYGLADTKLNMGSGFGIACGIAPLEKLMAKKEIEQPLVVGFAGDSTFFHASITRLFDVIQNPKPVLFVIFDNKTTAMTGHQPVPEINIGKLVDALNIPYEVINPFNFKNSCESVEKLINYVKEKKKPAVIISKSPCQLIKTEKSRDKYQINQDKCINCGICTNEFGCPAITRQEKASILENLCVGCGGCEQICLSKSIYKKGENERV